MMNMGGSKSMVMYFELPPIPSCSPLSLALGASWQWSCLDASLHPSLATSTQSEFKTSLFHLP